MCQITWVKLYGSIRKGQIEWVILKYVNLNGSTKLTCFVTGNTSHFTNNESACMHAEPSKCSANYGLSSSTAQ